jgi:hypothetical protein
MSPTQPINKPFEQKAFEPKPAPIEDPTSVLLNELRAALSMGPQSKNTTLPASLREILDHVKAHHGNTPEL